MDTAQTTPATKEQILQNILNDKELQKNLKAITHYSIEQFISDCERYLEAIKSGGMFCNIISVAPSGMSRILKFTHCKKHDDSDNYSFMQFWCFFKALGYTEVDKKDGFRVYGCGMDMVFNTNYNNIHSLKRLGFISGEDCAILAQKTPVVI